MLESELAARSERPAADGPRTSVLRAIAGAGLALAGVLLAVGALLLVTTPEDGSPVVSAAVDEPVYDTPALPPLPSTTPPPTPTPTPVAGSAAGPPPSSSAAAPAPPSGPPRLPVLVLNNSRETGLAARAAARFSAAGWPVRDTGNFTGRIRATTVYFEPGQRASAERFATTFRGIARVLPRPENIPGPRGLAVVLTRDFPA